MLVLADCAACESHLVTNAVALKEFPVFWENNPAWDGRLEPDVEMGHVESKRCGVTHKLKPRLKMQFTLHFRRIKSLTFNWTGYIYISCLFAGRLLVGFYITLLRSEAEFTRAFILMV